MGVLVDGEWHDTWYETKSTGGSFERAAAKFRNWITADGSAGPSGAGGFPAASGRYHLYVSYACPWAHRTLIFLNLKGLDDHITVSVVHPDMLTDGWTFAQDDQGATGDTLYNLGFAHNLYTKADPNFSGRVTVPILWDKERETIVSNESSEIIRMFNSAFDGLTGNNDDYWPGPMRNAIAPVNDRIYDTLNNGVYKCGFATSQAAYDAGFRLEHIGSILHAMLHDRYSSIVDKVQVKIYTDKAKVEALRTEAVAMYEQRDARLANMTDESVDTFYSCTLCQSFAPTHVCVITPERSGLCGAYSWLDGRAAYEITPTGPNQPIPKGNVVDGKLGQWEKINDFIKANSQGALEQMSAYSIIADPMTSCGCFECISAILPMTNGIMIVNREYPEMTPCGMKFSTLAGTVGGGNQVPGFIGHSKHYITSKKFISAEGGVPRIVWMPSALKEDVREALSQVAEASGLDASTFIDMIADERVATTEEEVMEYITQKGHPVMNLEPMF